MIAFLRRFGMSLLFIAALYSTFSTISNVTLADWLDVLKERELLPNSSLSTSSSAYLEGKEQKKSKLSLKAKSDEQTEQGLLAMNSFPTVRVTATGYTAGVESTGKTPDHPAYGITYSGVEVRRDTFSTIAADLDLFPLGTILYIPNYGYGVVADIGSAITGKKIDLYFPTVEDVYSKWGKKDVKVYVIQEGSGSLSEEELYELNEGSALKVFQEQF